MKETDSISMTRIGTVDRKVGSGVVVAPRFRPALAGLDEFSHVLVFWVFDQAPWDGKTLTTGPCYRKLDHDLGMFATRGPFRPSPIAMTACRVLSLDVPSGILMLDWIDAEDGSPVIDLKPYHPSSDIVADVTMPRWCAHWPQSREESGAFDWSAEFTF